MDRIYQGGYLISKIKQTSERIFDKKLKNHGIKDLNNAQGRILFNLWQEDHVPITELVKKTSLGKTTLTSMLKRLEERGYLVREEGKGDKRQTFISLTEKGKGIRKSYGDVSLEMLTLYYKGYSKEEIISFETMLEDILSHLTTYETGKEMKDHE